MVYKLDEMRGRVFTLAEVAEMLGVTPDAIRRRVRLGQLPVRRPPGSEMLVDGDELAAYLRGETSTTATPTKARKPKPKPERVESQAVALPFGGEAVAKPVEAPAPPAPAPTPPGPTRAEKIIPMLPKGDASPMPYKLPKPEANERFVAWMERRGLSQKAITEATGLESPKLSRIRSNEYAITRDTLAALRSGYGDALVQYLMGAGPMPEVEK